MSYNQKQVSMCCNLKLSPMFNLSMASKELFHSNMLYWISQVYPNEFKQVLNSLHIDTNQWPEKWEVHREKEHFDLSVTVKNSDKEEYIFILENKVKSIPYKRQLDEYVQKAGSGDKIQYLLLSLCTDFAHEDEICKSGWKIANNSDLAKAIKGIISQIPDSYHQALLKDYCSYIELLHGMQEQWKLNLDDNYCSVVVEADEDIKQLIDVKKKLLVSQMAQCLLDKIPGAVLAGNKEIEIKKDGKTTIPEEIKNGKVFINFGMTRSTGLIDLKVRVKGNLFLIIQVQGKQFKHCVEVLGNDPGEMAVINALKDYLENKLEKDQQSNVIAKRIIKDKFLSRQHGFLFDSSVFVETKSQKPFNKYGNSFIYQYINISDDATIENVLDEIINHINKIMNHINDYC